MKRNKKAGLLILILAVPAFVVLIGSFFKGEHKFELPYLNQKSIGAISLLSSDNESKILGKDSSTIYAVSFHCKYEEHVSNKVLSELTRVQEVYIDTKEPVELISVFCCGEEKPYLTDIVKLYDVKEKFWKLTIPNDNINELISTFGVQLNRDNKDYKEEAYTAIFLLDKQMKVRGFYNGISNDDVNKLIEDIRVLIHEYK